MLHINITLKEQKKYVSLLANCTLLCLMACLLAACVIEESTTIGSESPAPESPVHYAVNWDGDGDDTDNNRGVSTLHVTAFNADTGRILWQKEPLKLKSMYQSSKQQVVDDILYISSSGPASTYLLIVVDTKDGHVLWHKEEKQERSISSIKGGVVYTITIQAQQRYSQIEALNALDGKLLWSQKSSYQGWININVTKDIAYLIDVKIEQKSDKKLTVVDTSTITAREIKSGKTLWQKTKTNANASRYPYSDVSRYTFLQATDNAAYIVTTSSSMKAEHAFIEVEAYTPKNGNLLWKNHLPQIESSSLLTFNNSLYLNAMNRASNKSELLSLNATTGKVLWRHQHSFKQIVQLSDGSLYGQKASADTIHHNICALDTANGKERWCSNHIDVGLFSFSATKDVLVVTETTWNKPDALNQILYGLSKKDGKVLWKLPWKSSAPKVITITIATVANNQTFEKAV